MPGDSAGRVPCSQLMLFEDGNALGPPRSAHDVIRTTGHGAFSHWGRELWFSTSDNTSPETNRRRYAVVAESVEEGAARLGNVVTGNAPVNYQPLDAARAAIEKDAAYAIATAQSYVDCLPGGLAYLRNRSVLELGPGPNLGAALVLLCWGASHVAVADRFLVPFDPAYHLKLYQRLKQLLAEHASVVSLDPVVEVIRRKQHSAVGLRAYATALEDLANVIDAPFNVTASNAVFEHLFSPRAAILSLYRVTADDGIGLHQVDFRDHRDFSKPLEFLLDDERTFAVLFEKEFGQVGGRVRPFQMEAMFREAGFARVDFHANLFAEKNYLDVFVPRLRKALASPFCKTDVDALSPISGRFVVGRGS